MIVTLIKKENISTITLPDRISGQVWLTDLDEEGNRYDLISIEGINNQWIFKSNKMARLMDSNNAFLKNVIIKPLSFYNLVINGYSHKTFVFTEPVTEDRQLFKKLMIRGENEITIGRSDNNDIMFNNRFVSSNHANLTFFKSKWSISDLGSTNGTFVNGHRINTRLLFPGDTVYIMGFKIIIGNSFIAFNNPDEQVIVKSVKFVPFVMQTKDVAEDEDEDIEPQPSDYFYRSPRFKRDIEKTLFKVDSPPSSGTGEEMPVMLTLGPAMTMGMASLATGAFAVNNALTTGNLNGAIPSVVMSSSMLLGTVLWPILAKKFEKKRKKKKENTRQLKYKEYLYKVQEKFAEESLKQAEILHENHVPVSECAERIQNVQRNLWERGLGQNDFLKLRVGLGNVPLSAEISYSERRFSVDNDNLQEDMYSLCETPKVLQDVPITLSLFDNYICGVIGERTITDRKSVV